MLFFVFVFLLIHFCVKSSFRPGVLPPTEVNLTRFFAAQFRSREPLSGQYKGTSADQFVHWRLTPRTISVYVQIGLIY